MSRNIVYYIVTYIVISLLLSGCSMTEALKENSSCKATVELECDCSCEDSDKEGINSAAIGS